MASNSDTQKMTVTFPARLLERLRELVPARERSAFIVEAVEERLALQEQLAAIEETAGCWLDENHPEIQTGEDIERWLADLRETWNEHLIAGDSGAGDESEIPSR